MKTYRVTLECEEVVEVEDDATDEDIGQAAIDQANTGAAPEFEVTAIEKEE